MEEIDRFVRAGVKVWGTVALLVVDADLILKVDHQELSLKTARSKP